jgi:hypothetical protein
VISLPDLAAWMPFLNQANLTHVSTAKRSNGASDKNRIAPFEGGGNQKKLLSRFGCFGRDNRFVQAALTTIGDVAMNDSTLRCLIQSGGEGVEFGFCRSGVATGDDGAKLLLT